MTKWGQLCFTFSLHCHLQEQIGCQLTACSSYSWYSITFQNKEILSVEHSSINQESKGSFASTLEVLQVTKVLVRKITPITYLSP